MINFNHSLLIINNSEIQLMVGGKICLGGGKKSGTKEAKLKGE